VTAEELLADFKNRGIALRRKGTRIHYRAPSGTLTDNDKDALRAVKLQLLTLVPAEAPPPSQSPFDQLMSQWQAIANRVQALFRRNDIQPSSETLQATTWLAFQLDEGWPFWNIRKSDARQFLLAIVQGRCVARLDDYGRVALRNARRPGTRIVL
jgi:hypothetical protein